MNDSPIVRGTSVQAPPRGGTALAVLAPAADPAPLAAAIEGTRLELAQGASGAIESLARSVHELVLVDLSAVGAGSLIGQLRDLDPVVPIVALAASGGLPASEARRAGATAHVGTPWVDELPHAVRTELAIARLRRELEIMRRSPHVVPGPEPVSAAGIRLLSDLRAAAAGDAPVLLAGEPGTGQREAALRLHRMSARGAGPFVVLPAASLDPERAALELLGRGAPADALRRGLLELASGGTLLVEGLDRLPPPALAAIVAAIEGRPHRRPGDERWVHADVRIVVAGSGGPESLLRRTGRAEIARVEIALPPLRERPEDVVPQARAIVERLGIGAGLPALALSAEAEALIAGAPWPGNLFQLESSLARAAAAAGGSPIEPRHLPADVRTAARTDDGSLELAVRARVLEIYERNGGNITRTAAQLGISRVALRRKLRRYGVIPPAAKDLAREPG